MMRRMAFISVFACVMAVLAAAAYLGVALRAAATIGIRYVPIAPNVFVSQKTMAQWVATRNERAIDTHALALWDGVTARNQRALPRCSARRLRHVVLSHVRSTRLRRRASPPRARARLSISRRSSASSRPRAILSFARDYRERHSDQRSLQPGDEGIRRYRIRRVACTRPALVWLGRSMPGRRISSRTFDRTDGDDAQADLRPLFEHAADGDLVSGRDPD